MKDILIKIPYKSIWTLGSLVMILGANSSWWGNRLSDMLFWIFFIIYIYIAAYWFYLFSKFYSKKSLKQIVINADDNIVLIYQLLRHGKSRSRDYRVRKQNLKIVVKGNIMNILGNGKSIAKIYRNTLKDKNNWEWLINYFSNYQS